MEKPTIATNIDGLLIEHEAFIEPHKAWFDMAIEKTGDLSLEKWKGHPTYWQGVNPAMEKIMPNATHSQRKSQARTWYQEFVITYIKKHPEVVKTKIADKLRNLKDRYQLALITTNTQTHINKILKISKLDDIYEIILASKLDEEPNKQELIEEFIQRYGKPKYYLSGKQEKEITELLKEKKVKVISLDELDSI